MRSCYRLPDGTWDREYVRITAIFRLMKNGHANRKIARWRHEGKIDV